MILFFVSLKKEWIVTFFSGMVIRLSGLFVLRNRLLFVFIKELYNFVIITDGGGFPDSEVRRCPLRFRTVNNISLRGRANTKKVEL